MFLWGAFTIVKLSWTHYYWMWDSTLAKQCTVLIVEIEVHCVTLFLIEHFFLQSELSNVSIIKKYVEIIGESWKVTGRTDFFWSFEQTSYNFTFPMGVRGDATLWPASVVVKFMPPLHCVAVCHDEGRWAWHKHIFNFHNELLSSDFVSFGWTFLSFWSSQ